MIRSIRLEESFKVSPETLYDAWLDSTKHTEMTGGKAICSNVINGAFSAWDEYITGTNKSLIPKTEIIQSWRTSEFLDSDDDSELIIRISRTEEGSHLKLMHNYIPEGQPDYEKGWREYYFNPMKEYFK